MFYIFLIAVLNLGLGFAAAMQLGRRYNCLASGPASLDSSAITEPTDEDVEVDSSTSSMELGTDEDVDTINDESVEEIQDAAADDSLDADTVVKHDEGAEKQGQKPGADEFESDLDKLFEDIDI